MLTRKDYINGNCSHNEYYGEIVSLANITAPSWIMEMVKDSNDDHYNDIPLTKWDSAGQSITQNFKIKSILEERGDSLTAAGIVCMMKQAAKRQLKA